MPVPIEEPQPLAAATPQITLTYTLLDMSGAELGSASNPAYLRIGLCGYGSVLPCVPGTCMIGKVATWPGDIPYLGAPGTVKLWGNDVISPAGTFYFIAVLDPNHNVIQSGIYTFSGTQNVDLSNLQPILPQPSLLMTEYVVVMTGPGLSVTLPSTPSPGTLVQLWRSGIKLSVVAGDYSIAGAVVTFAQPYLKGDVIDVIYSYSTTTSLPPPPGIETEFTAVMTGPGTTVTLPTAPIAGTFVKVWRSGIKLSVVAGDYTIAGTVITFTKAYFSGDVIDVIYTAATS